MHQTHTPVDTSSTDTPTDTEGHPSTITVVIVDDHQLLATVVAQALSTIADISVVAIADSCRSGVAAVAEHRPDVLLLDQRLPDGLGTDILPAMLAASPGMKVLMVSGENPDEVLVKAVSAGASGFVAKGARAAALVQAVRAAAQDLVGAARHDTPSLLEAASASPAVAVEAVTMSLTDRERQVLGLLSAGHDIDAMAAQLAVTPATARRHVRSIVHKLGAHGSAEAVQIAERHRLTRAS